MIICSFVVFISTSIMSQANALDRVFQNGNVNKIDISVNIMPIIDSKYYYTFSTNNQCTIYYIIHLLDSMDLTDDGKIIKGADVSSVNIQITKNDGLVDEIGFFAERFYDSNNKQFAVSKKDYNRFLDAIYALKTKTLILPDKVTYEPSDWSKESVEKAISNNLVPEWNQINYIGNITRLEVCQLIENLLNKDGYINDKLELSPFSDTKDKSVTLSRALNIISGKSETEFCPYDYITREEFSRILSQTYKLMLNDDFPALTVQYKDKEQISDWAIESVGIVTSLGLMQGDENDRFSPKDNITKEQVIMTLLRLDELDKQ